MGYNKENNIDVYHRMLMPDMGLRSKDLVVCCGYAGEDGTNGRLHCGVLAGQPLLIVIRL